MVAKGGARPVGAEWQSGTGEAVSVGGFDDEAGRGHGGETFVESGGSDAAGCAQFGEWPRVGSVRESRSDALIHGDWLDAAFRLEISLDGLQGKSVIALREFERHSGPGGGGAMLDGQDDPIIVVAAKVEVGITPGVEFGRSTQGLAGADGAGSLPGMMYDRHGDAMTALRLTQEGEQRCDIAADIFIDAVQAHEGIEDEQPWLQPGNGLVETRAVGGEIEPQAGGGDHLDVERGKADSSSGADALETAADDMERVFGGIEQDATGAAEGFAAFWLAADDPHSFVGPQPVDEPTLLLGAIGETPGRLNRKRGHRRRRITDLVSIVVGTPQVSKNSASSI